MWFIIFAFAVAIRTLPVTCGIGEPKRPNILIILTDDQDIELGGLEPMRNVKQLIADKGATFQNAVSRVYKFCIRFLYFSLA